MKHCNVHISAMPGRLLLLLTLLAGLAACDPYEQDRYREFLVVESYLKAGAPLPQVRLTRTLPLEEEYTLRKAAVPDGEVRIELLDAGDNPEESYPYRHDSTGIYRPVSPGGATVLPRRRYRLVAEVPGEETLRAETLVPGAFRATDIAVDSTAYQSPDQIEVTTSPSHYPGRQTFFIFTLVVDEPLAENLTPFYRDQWEDEDEAGQEEMLQELARNSSGIINEENYERDDNGAITLRLPWIAVAFYGPNNLVASAVDDNMYDFLRSQSVQTGGSTLPPGEIQNVKYNIEGGIGVFGSLATDTVSIYIARTNE